MTHHDSRPLSGWKDKVLFTPGPLTTSRTVKQAMLRDLGSRDFEFIEMVREIRQELLTLGEVAAPDYEVIIMQGSGTFSIEAVISSVTPPDGKWLLIINGAYGRRMAQITAIYHLPTLTLTFPENDVPALAQIEDALLSNPDITHVGVVHCETTSGIINPVAEIGELLHRYGKGYFVDAMSSFGAVPLDIAAAHIDFLVSSANKCIEGVPGFGFALARREALLATEGYARSLSLDLLAQWRGLEANGQFRFTPPTHALLAFRQALRELEQEGGVNGRHARYRRNYLTLVTGMRQMGFREFVPAEKQGPIITSFYYPDHPNFNFEQFYSLLNERDVVIYPGKVSAADCLRIGNIGRIFPADVRNLLAAIRETLAEMSVELF
jgi:2-aminoethylphosphonate-pyruvate transaminase